jgi:hypothetical protein
MSLSNQRPTFGLLCGPGIAAIWLSPTLPVSAPIRPRALLFPTPRRWHQRRNFAAASPIGPVTQGCAPGRQGDAKLDNVWRLCLLNPLAVVSRIRVRLHYFAVKYC